LSRRGKGRKKLEPPPTPAAQQSSDRQADDNQYRQERTADATGHVQWVIPYTANGIGVALLVNGQKRERWDKALIITDRDVREGQTIFY